MNFRPGNFDYKWHFTEEEKASRKEWVKEQKRLANKIAKHYNSIIATYIKLFCEQKKCEPSDLAIYEQIDCGGGIHKIWIDFK